MRIMLLLTYGQLFDVDGPKVEDFPEIIATVSYNFVW